MAKQCTELLGRYLELSAKKSLKPFIPNVAWLQ